MDSEKEITAKMIAITNDETLTEEEKNKKRQELMDSKSKATKHDYDTGAKEQGNDEAADDIDENLKCVFCLDPCERPVTAPCQHNFCLNCFKKYITTQKQGKESCPTCRAALPSSLCQNPRINTALATAIRMARQGKGKAAAPKPAARVEAQQRPDDAFTTERAVRAGRANAASGRIMVAVPQHHFGPILPEHDPEHGKGVRVGDTYRDRLHCRQWGAHFPHVAGIAGTAALGAQSVVLSGGYPDDRDEGEWFLYTGSGGRDLSGNKRTNKEQSFDQTFTLSNEALKQSCLKGLPVRVVRSAKEKRSAYAPAVDPAAAAAAAGSSSQGQGVVMGDNMVRYDGIYRVLKAWRKPGQQGLLVCRYLFVRADNEPAPWAGADAADEPKFELPAVVVEEVAQAAGGQVWEMGPEPHWDYDAASKTWGWAKPPPASCKAGQAGKAPADPIVAMKKQLAALERELQQLHCKLCASVLRQPVTTPCGHSFCQPCLAQMLASIQDVAPTARRLRERRNPKPCPTCRKDLGQVMDGAQVNRAMVPIISAKVEEVQQAREQVAALVGEEGAAAAGGGTQEEPLSQQQQQQQQQQQVQEEPQQAAPEAPGPSAARAAAGGAAQAAPAKAQRWASELAALAADFPEFDGDLVGGLLEDQGGDVAEVRAYLRRMRSESAAAERKQRKPAARAGKKGSSRAAAEEEAKEEEKGEKEEAAAASPAAAAAAEEGEAMQVDGTWGSASPGAGEQPAAAAAAAAGPSSSSLSQDDAGGAADQQQGGARKRGRAGKAAAVPAAAKRRRGAA